MAYQEKQSRADFFRKLGYYAAGIAIGFIALGFFNQMKRIEAERKAKAEANPIPLKESPLFPPPPGSAPATAAAPASMPERSPSDQPK